MWHQLVAALSMVLSFHPRCSEDAKAARTRTIDQYKGVDSELETWAAKSLGPGSTLRL